MKELIKVSKQTKLKLDKLKEELGYKTYNDVIVYLINFYEDHKNFFFNFDELQKYLKNLGKIFK